MSRDATAQALAEEIAWAKTLLLAAVPLMGPTRAYKLKLQICADHDVSSGAAQLALSRLIDSGDLIADEDWISLPSPSKESG